MMNRYYHIIFLLGLLLLLASCGKHDLDSAIQQGSKKLSDRQITDLVAGSSVKMAGYGQTATVEFRRDGTLSGANISGEKDKGEWRAKEDELCLRFKDWGEGDSICYQVVQNDSQYMLYNRKGMMIFDLKVLTPGPKEDPKNIVSIPPVGSSAGPPSSGSEIAPPRELPPPSPHAAADVEFIIRQSAQNCPGCNLARAQLAGQTLIGANLQGANLAEADLSNANLRRANLKGANLYRANLRHADISGADLTGANLSEAIRE